jgi:hypothetical protein
MSLSDDYISREDVYSTLDREREREKEKTLADTIFLED